MEEKVTKADVVSSFKSIRQLLKLAQSTLNARNAKEVQSGWFLEELDAIAMELMGEANILAQFVVDAKFELYNQDAELMQEEAKVFAKLNK